MLICPRMSVLSNGGGSSSRCLHPAKEKKSLSSSDLSEVYCIRLAKRLIKKTSFYVGEYKMIKTALPM